MDQDLLNLIFGAVMGVFGWLGKTIWEAVDSLKRDIKKIEVDLPTSYVRKDDMESRFDKIEAMLERLFSKLDSKVDK
jgi:hypothetical protein